MERTRRAMSLNSGRFSFGASAAWLPLTMACGVFVSRMTSAKGPRAHIKWKPLAATATKAASGNEITERLNNERSDTCFECRVGKLGGWDDARKVGGWDGEPFPQ